MYWLPFELPLQVFIYEY